MPDGGGTGRGTEGPAGWAGPLHERVLDLAGLRTGTRVLDLGCGSGDLARRAADRGAVVLGIDTDRAEVARARAGAAARSSPPGARPGPAARAEPGRGAAGPAARPSPVGAGTGPAGAAPAAPATAGTATFAFGDAHDPPPGPFDVVTAVQLLPHVTNPLVVLRAAARVGDLVAVTTWGRDEECDVRAFADALAPWLGPRRPALGPPPLTEPARLRKLVRLAGLEVAAVDEVVCPFAYPDADGLVDALLASGIGRSAARLAGPAAVRGAVLARLERHRTSDGGYVLRNLVRVLTARRQG